MRVLHVIPSVGLTYGGSSIAVLNLSRSLAQRGVDVDIVTTNVDGSQILDVPLQTWIEEENYRIKYFSCIYLKDYKISISMSQWLFKYVKDYDLVNTHSIFSSSIFPAYQACQIHHVPYVIHPHGMLESWALTYKKWKKAPYYALIEKPAIQRASTIRVLVSQEAESIKTLKLTVPLATVPNGIWEQDFTKLSDPEIFYQNFPETRHKTLILFLGRIDPKKGLDLLAPALAKVRSQFPHIHLIVAGPDNTGFLPTAKSYFADTDCLDAVTFTGMLIGNLKAAALAASDLYVAPSYSEGFSMSVLEGMASSLPCVITTGCNFPEATNAQAAHVVGMTSDAIANALLRCLNHPDEAKAMGDRARQFILENYTWDKIAVQMKQVYIDILKSH